MMKTRQFHKVDLPDELMIEIMVRLPAKSLVRFKYVSKSWYAIITDPSFIAKQVECSNSIINKSRHSKVIFQIRPSEKPAYISMISYGEKRYMVQDLKLPFLDNNADLVFVWDQCNEILCLYGPSHIILWNPATKEVKAIPKRNPRYQYISVIGFGFDPITKDYKIVRLLGDGKHYIEVSSEHDGTYILSFDFSKEVLGVIKLPLEVSSSAESVGVLGESLACVSFARFGNFEIWVMNEYGVENSWTKKFNIEPNLFSMHMLGFLGENEIHVKENFNQLVSYNLQNQHRRRFQKCSLPFQ
ncbi:hypothetical protein K1719_042540 [Acacia pycnantha]|nr:hypothetical protein K1719_042540 [Acacia pycnantha]